MRTTELRRGAGDTPAVLAGGGFALLTLVTHAANFSFVVAAGRLLPPEAFGQVVGLLGIVLLGLAPGMAMQARTAAGVVDARGIPDPSILRRLTAATGAGVLVATVVATSVLDVDGLLVWLTVPVAAVLLTRTAINEGLLQGHGRFLTLGCVMAAGALTKLVAGVGAAWVRSDIGWVTAAVTLGYLVQLAGSRRATTVLRDDDHASGDVRGVVYAVVLTGSLLVVIHLDAVLAPGVLVALEAGRYGVGVTASRTVFWLPQFAVLLWYPRMVRSTGPSVLRGALLAVLSLGLVGLVAAAALGPLLTRLVFGPELGAIGPHLWRFVVVGAAALTLQIVVLVDLARGRRDAWRVLVPAPVAVAAALTLSPPSSADAAVARVAAVLGAAAAAAAVAALRREGRR